MSMIIDGTNGLTFNNATTQASAGLVAGGTIATGTITTATISTLNAPSGVLATQNGMTGIAKAWVNFNGTNGNINASFNVSSVTRTATGTYTVTFSTAMPDTYYTTLAASTDTPTYQALAGGSGNSTGSTVITAFNRGSGAATDYNPIFVVCHR